MEFETKVAIEASRQTVWATLSDVEHWSGWTASITTVDLVDKPLAAGSSAKVIQPKLRPATYTVTACSEGNEFTWQTTMPGITIIASHVIDGPAEGPVTVTLGIKQSGPLSPLVSLMYGKLTRSYVAMEAAGLKQACEAA